MVLEPVYSLFTLHQAKRRAFRPTQTQDCEVTYVCYAGSMSETAIRIVARKSAAAAILNGDDLSNGLLEFDPGMSLLQELAKAVMADDDDRTGLSDDVRAMLRDGAAALKADLEVGTTGLVGVDAMLDAADVDAPTAVATTTTCPASVALTPSCPRYPDVSLPLFQLADDAFDDSGISDCDGVTTTDEPMQLSLFGDVRNHRSLDGHVPFLSLRSRW